MKENDIYKVTIFDEDNIGNGICRIDNMVVFVKSALKDDYLEIKIDKVKKNYAYAYIKKILNPSKNRIISKCKYYDSCGGCTFLHTTYNHEREIKHNYIEKLFDRKVDYLPSKKELNYRNKVTLHVKNGIIGMYSENTHNICEINECLLLNPKINEKIKELKRFDLSKVNEIMIRCINNKIMISVKSTIDDINLKNIKCDSLYINNELIKGEKYLIDEVKNFKFTIYPESFYQVNKDTMISLYDKAYDLLNKSKSLLDLYCGTGTIGIWMSNKFDKVTGVEINSSAISNANINKELNNINNIGFICNDAKNIKNKFDTIIVDPPRNGLSVYVHEYLNNSGASEIIYISCNPNTLKRDIEFMNHYEIKSISCADMFPRTKHVECVCLLMRK